MRKNAKMNQMKADMEHTVLTLAASKNVVKKLELKAIHISG